MKYLSPIPRGIWVLGFVSLFMDISSEMIHGLLPVYLVTVMGASALTVGFIEGIAEAAVPITKIFSGALSDYLGKRKLLVTIGYGMAGITKPLFPLAAGIEAILVARFVDRAGKGIRGAPRDALVADLSPPELRGAAFGLRQSLDTVGAFIGPLAAIFFMWLFLENFKIVFWIAVVPAVLAFLLVIFGVEDPKEEGQKKSRVSLQLSDFRLLTKSCWAIILVASLFSLARFSEAFLILKAQDVGLPITLMPAVLILMNVVYAASSYPIGSLSDRFPRFYLLIFGILSLMVSQFLLAFSGNVWWIATGIAFWGLHMGMTQGIFAALVADVAPNHLRGTAFGIFNFVTGIVTVLSNVIAGVLWDFYGPSATFLMGAGIALLTILVSWRVASNSVFNFNKQGEQ